MTAIQEKSVKKYDYFKRKVCFCNAFMLEKVI